MNSKMLFYILKRVLLALLTIWIVITVTFFVMHSIPGGPFASEKAISAEAQAALEAKYGLDKPLGEQYVTYLRDVVTKLDFGPSLKQRGRQVIDISCTNSTNRYAMMHIAEDMLMNTGCIVPLYYYTDIYMLDDSVQGFFSNPLGYKYFMHCTVAK